MPVFSPDQQTLRTDTNDLPEVGEIVLTHGLAGRVGNFCYRLPVAFDHFHDDGQGLEAGIIGQTGTDSKRQQGLPCSDGRFRVHAPW